MHARALGSAIAVLALSIGLVGCCGRGKAKEGPGGGSAQAPATTATGATAKPEATSTAPSVPAGLPSCSKTALLDMATPSRPPIATPVLGVRMPAGGTPKAKTAVLFSIDYLTRDTPKIEVACTIREQLEKDKWTIESMVGSSIVTMVARKGNSAVQIMVGPASGGAAELISTAIVTPRK